MYFQSLPQPIRSEHGAGLLTWRKRGQSLLLLNFSKRYFSSQYSANQKLFQSEQLVFLFMLSWTQTCLCYDVSLSLSTSHFHKAGIALRWGWSWRDWTHLTRLYSACSLLQRYCCWFLFLGCFQWKTEHFSTPLEIILNLTRAYVYLFRTSDPRLQDKTPLWWLPRVLWLLGKRRLMGY